MERKGGGVFGDTALLPDGGFTVGGQHEDGCDGAQLRPPAAWACQIWRRGRDVVNALMLTAGACN